MCRGPKRSGEQLEVSRKFLDCADVGTCGMLSVITALEFLQHHFAKTGHRNTSCDPHLHQAIEQPMLHPLTRSVRRRAATSKRGNRPSLTMPTLSNLFCAHFF